MHKLCVTYGIFNWNFWKKYTWNEDIENLNNQKIRNQLSNLTLSATNDLPRFWVYCFVHLTQLTSIDLSWSQLISVDPSSRWNIIDDPNYRIDGSICVRRLYPRKVNTLMLKLGKKQFKLITSLSMNEHMEEQIDSFMDKMRSERLNNAEFSGHRIDKFLIRNIGYSFLGRTWIYDLKSDKQR